MEHAELYKGLCSKMGLPDSGSLLKIWSILCTPGEADIAAMLPATAADLASRSGKGIDEVQSVLDSLFQKGAVFKAKKESAVSYKLAKNIIQFHDASLVWKGADQEFYDLWKKVMDEDFAALMKNIPASVVLPSFMRVIPVGETITMQSGVLPYEACAELVNRAERLAVVQCPCRLSQHNCDAPLESCIQIDRGADYALDRGHGRAINKEQALNILKQCEDAGLVHMAENRGFGNAICNCCSCCCEMFRLTANSGKNWILAPSRYRAVVDKEKCIACGACEDACPVEAIKVDDSALVDENKCLGCGLCAGACAEEAISLEQIRPESHIPVK